MTKHVQCPHCGQAYALTEEQVATYSGNDITCTQCGDSFLVSQDLAMTGGLATEPTTYETRPEATAAAFPSPPPYAPRMAYGAFGAGAAGATGAPIPPPNVALGQPYNYGASAPSAPSIPRPFYDTSLYRRPVDSNGWAVASIICAVIGLVVPIVPGVLAVLFGILGIRRLRETDTGAGMALGGIVVGVMSMLISGGVFYTYVMPAMQNVRIGSSQARCTENMKKLGHGLRQYAAANGGRFPDKLESLVTSGKATAELLVCPASGDTVAPGTTPAAQAANLRSGKHVSYIYVGENLTTASPAECVLMYETPDRHGDGMYVLFADGRVQSIGDVEAGKAITRLSRGVNPPWTSSGK